MKCVQHLSCRTNYGDIYALHIKIFWSTCSKRQLIPRIIATYRAEEKLCRQWKYFVCNLWQRWRLRLVPKAAESWSRNKFHNTNSVTSKVNLRPRYSTLFAVSQNFVYAVGYWQAEEALLWGIKLTITHITLFNFIARKTKGMLLLPMPSNVKNGVQRLLLFLVQLCCI